MKKLSPEFRVGAVTILIIVLFIWLFSFLKGRNMLSNYDHYTIRYENVAGLDPSSPVEISGLKAGIVSSVNLINDGSGIIEVMISIEKDYNIPDNSVAEITTASLIAGMKINIKLGDSKTLLHSGAYMNGSVAQSIIDKLNNNFDPVIYNTTKLIGNIDSLVEKMNLLFTPHFTNNISESADNLNMASGEFRSLLEDNSDNLGEIITNLNSVGKMLGQNIEKFDSTITSVNKLTSAISQSEIDSSLAALKLTLDNSSSILEKLNNGDGSAGKLLNDDTLYLNLSSTLNSLEILLKDIEENPGKYVHFSIFGGKKE